MTRSKTTISRREALKIAGITGAALALNPMIAPSQAQAAPIASKGKIVVIGAGAAGVSTAARLYELLIEPDITIIDDTQTHLYQPAFSLIAGGVVGADYPKLDNADYIRAKWIKQKAIAIDPDGKSVTTANGETIGYDFLVIAAGIDLNYEAIEGLDRSMLGKNGIASVYAYESAVAAWDQLRELSQNSRSRKVSALFCETATPIKCGGAPKKIAFLAQDYIRRNGKRDNAELTQMMTGSAWFGVKVYADAIEKLYSKREMAGNFKHKLVKIDADRREATFAVPKLVMDEELGIELEKSELIVKPYDFIHVVPNQSGAAVVAQNPKLANPTGFLKVNIQTLQSETYPEIFGAGDIVATPFGKTGGSVRKHYKIVAQNLVDVMHGKAPSQRYDGYTVCPLITNYGSVMMLEFGYKGADGSDTLLPSAPLDPTQERWMWWLVKVHALLPIYKTMLRASA
ncbi:MAG: NAD(P)/FAD-dependent oxidoreductase [Helicobacteraceae bacterium]|jgi:sulfide:quinone oxidoreductase|nr:NAD(P)/FAD-dependent oxidoreductase [Helicobacteraceae bacterium]